ncbi:MULTISPECIES: YncE family protein [Hyphomonas]|uniref:PKD/Chitinase domain-containing protein n=1 Tax=Hyphomonas adhaerens TaxID=81029 RepID=A0A3B9GXD5_9PROT|nr:MULTISPECIES: hypothetical protein [Hyphomonas]MBB41117.1 hypothetical protein [Hyphomonas sp.]HAE27109.1 hypothetical protein [Hyphomonas adhaerens]
MAKQRLAAAIAALMWVAACGGGGGSGSGTSAPASSPNQAPVSVAGESFSAHIEADGTPLDGSQSWDPDSDALSFEWVIVSEPEGAGAQFNDATDVRPKLQARAPGTYEIELTVTDPAGASGHDTIVVSLENDAPEPKAAVSLSMPALGEDIELTAVKTTDINGQPLTYTWTLETAPAGVMVGTTYDGVTQTTSFDVEGAYGFSLTVSDGYDTVTVDIPVIFASKFSVRKLPVGFGAMGVQPGGGRLVVRLQRQIAIFDEGVREPKLVSVPGDGVIGVAVSPNGHLAALGSYHAVTFVDLDKAEVVATWPVGASPVNLVVSDEGIAYITDQRDGSTDLVSVNMENGESITTPGRYPDSRGYMPPSGDKLYFMANVSPDVLGRYTISDGVFSDYREAADASGTCGTGWISGDGSAMLTSCGRVVRLSDDPATDMTTIGKIYNLGAVQSATYSPITKYWYVVGPPNEAYQSKILVYDSRNFELIHTIEMPLEHGSSGNQLVVRDIIASQTDLSLRILATDHLTLNVDHYMLVTALEYPAGANLPPEVSVQKYSATYAGKAVTIDASASSDPEGLPLTYSWRVAAEPSPGWATLENADTAVVRMTPAMEGEYSLELTVSDGVHKVVRQIGVLVSPGKDAVFYRLPGDILDAEYSKPLSTLAYIVDGESSIHLVNLLTFKEEIVPLERQAYRIGIGPDGLQAALSLSGLLNLVDLQTAKVVDSAPTAWDWGDIVLDRNGRAHMNTERGNTGPLVTVDFGSDQVSLNYSVFLGTLLRMHPLENWIYGVTTRQTPAILRKWDATTLPVQSIRSETIGVDKDELGGNIWFSEDGQRMLTATGKLFTISGNDSEDLLLDKTIQDGIFAAWADHSSETGEWAVVIGNSANVPSLNGKVAFYDDQTLTRKSAAELRDVPIGGTLYPVLAARIFYSEDGSGQVIMTSNLGATADPITVQVLNLLN